MRRGLVLLMACWPLGLPAQDTAAVERGVRVGITYRPGTRPGIAVLPAPVGLDSVRAVIHRDLDYSDRFEVVMMPGADSLDLAGGDPTAGSGALNYPLYRALGAEFVVSFGGTGTAPHIALHRVVSSDVVREYPVDLSGVRGDDARMRLHGVADDIVRVVTGTPGIAATRLLFVQGSRAWMVDADGAQARPVTGGDARALSPTWSPDGSRFAYMTLEDDGQGRLHEQSTVGGAPRLVFGTGSAQNATPEYFPDGQRMVFARTVDGHFDVYVVNVRQSCCLQRLTVGRFSDNLSPTLSPDGARVAFISTRAGSPQVYVMASDGTGQELFAPFDYGVTGDSYAPAWSPDGQAVAFHRLVDGTPQLFVLDVRTRAVRQVTSLGRNEDATWAPDSRHLAFVSDRTGSRQIWVIDLETGRVRQLTRVGGTRLPAWSPRIEAAAPGALTP